MRDGADASDVRTDRRRDRGDPPPLDPVVAALAAYRAIVAEMHEAHAVELLPAETASRIFGLAFALEQITAHLEDLHSRVVEFKRPEARKWRFGLKRR